GSYPYLKSVESKWEESAPAFMEQATYTVAELNEKLGLSLAATETPDLHIERTASNRVKEMQVNGEVFSGVDVREKLDLRSTDFTIVQQAGEYIFTTKGFGHGVGMSQYGANG